MKHWLWVQKFKVQSYVSKTYFERSLLSKLQKNVPTDEMAIAEGRVSSSVGISFGVQLHAWPLNPSNQSPIIEWN